MGYKTGEKAIHTSGGRHEVCVVVKEYKNGEYRISFQDGSTDRTNGVFLSHYTEENKKIFGVR